MDQVSTSMNPASYASTATSRRYGEYHKEQIIGNPQLSEQASQYYEELKKKFSGMSFVLVSREQKQQAQANAASYASPDKMVVLIDEDKIERMATDEAYRTQYEGVIANASGELAQMSSQLTTSGQMVKGYGMQIDDKGMASYFAVLEKSSAAQKERIEKKAEKNRQAKKDAAKKAKKKEQQERLEESGKTKKETITVKASSIEELIQKIKEQNPDTEKTILTKEEQITGQRFDQSV
ncbi:MAG: DUF6033 family protein [Lachnospiraceae bacterium]|nr:DUF6033 family protein [Clostridium sp.]MDD6616624.1 DUF6033 family protein [Lachnospiraceae bacterium]